MPEKRKFVGIKQATDEILQHRKELLERMQVLEAKRASLNEEARAAKIDMCEKKGHFMQMLRREKVEDRPGVFLISNVCRCCGKRETVEETATTRSTEDRFFREKQNALVRLERFYEDAHTQVISEENQIRESLERLCNEYIDKKLRPSGRSFRPGRGMQTVYDYGTEEDAKRIRDNWLKIDADIK